MPAHHGAGQFDAAQVRQDPQRGRAQEFGEAVVGGLGQVLVYEEGGSGPPGRVVQDLAGGVRAGRLAGGQREQRGVHGPQADLADVDRDVVDTGLEELARQGHPQGGAPRESRGQEHALGHHAGQTGDQARRHAQGEGERAYAVGDHEQGAVADAGADVADGAGDVVEGDVVVGVAAARLVVRKPAAASPVEQPGLVPVVQEHVDQVAGLGQQEHVGGRGVSVQEQDGRAVVVAGGDPGQAEA